MGALKTYSDEASRHSTASSSRIIPVLKSFVAQTSLGARFRRWIRSLFFFWRKEPAQLSLETQLIDVLKIQSPLESPASLTCFRQLLKMGNISIKTQTPETSEFLQECQYFCLRTYLEKDDASWEDLQKISAHHKPKQLGTAFQLLGTSLFIDTKAKTLFHNLLEAYDPEAAARTLLEMSRQRSEVSKFVPLLTYDPGGLRLIEKIMTIPKINLDNLQELTVTARSFLPQYLDHVISACALPAGQKERALTALRVLNEENLHLSQDLISKLLQLENPQVIALEIIAAHQRNSTEFEALIVREDFAAETLLELNTLVKAPKPSLVEDTENLMLVFKAQTDRLTLKQKEKIWELLIKKDPLINPAPSN